MPPETSVYAKWSDGLWYPAMIESQDASGILVRFTEDGSTKTVETHELSTESDSPSSEYTGVEPGSKIIAPWTDGNYYRAEVTMIRGKLFRVRFDDGFEAWVDDVAPESEGIEPAQEPAQEDFSAEALENVEATCRKLDEITDIDGSLDQMHELLQQIEGTSHRLILLPLLRVYERFPEHDGYGVFETVRHAIERVMVRDPSAVADIKASYRRVPSLYGSILLSRESRAGDEEATELLKSALSRDDVAPSLKREIAGFVE